MIFSSHLYKLIQMTDIIEIEAYDETYFNDFDSDSDSEECTHPQQSNIDGNTLCMVCGLKIDEALIDNETRYYGNSDTRYSKDPSRHNQRKSEERTLYKDLEPKGFPQEIIEQADSYYRHIIKDKIYRAGNRQSIVFACVYHAYEDIGQPKLPVELAKQFGLNKKGISNGMKTFSNTFRNRPNKSQISPIDLVPKILNDMNISPDDQKIWLENIKKIYSHVCGAGCSFISSNPGSIAAGLVYFYTRIRKDKDPITRGNFGSVVGMTDITFTKIAQNIGKKLEVENQMSKL